MADLLRDGNLQDLATDLLDPSQQMTPQLQRVASVLSGKIRMYRQHRSFGWAHRTQRVGALNGVKGQLLRMRREPCLDQAKWTELKDLVNAEFYFLDKLHRHHKQRDSQFTELISALDNSLGQAFSKKVKTNVGGRVHTSLRGVFIMERLDPLHRGRKPVKALKLYLEFKKWIAGGTSAVPTAVANASPWDQMMAYFLHLHDQDPSETKISPSYHGDKQRFFDSLEFDGMNIMVTNQNTGGTTLKRIGKALGYYAFLPDGQGQTKYEQYSYREHGHTRFPYQSPLHTVSKQRKGSHAVGSEWASTVTYPENNQKGRGFSDETPQLSWAKLYVLVNNTMFVGQNSDFHSYAAAGGSVGAAGNIAADNGKIVAIDNASGHYAPNWRQLRQAVQLIANNGAFADDAQVALMYKWDHPVHKNAFTGAILPWMDFLRLCHVIRDRSQRMQVWTSMTSQYQPLPTVAQHCHGTLAVFDRIWRGHNFDWERVGTDLFSYLDTPEGRA